MLNNISYDTEKNNNNYKEYQEIFEKQKELGKKLGFLIYGISNQKDKRPVYFDNIAMDDFAKKLDQIKGKYALNILKRGEFRKLRTTIDNHIVDFTIHPGDSQTYHIRPTIDGKYLGSSICVNVFVGSSGSVYNSTYLCDDNKNITYEILIKPKGIFRRSTEEELQIQEQYHKHMEESRMQYTEEIESVKNRVKKILLSKEKWDNLQEEILNKHMNPIKTKYREGIENITQKTDEYEYIKNMMNIIYRGLENAHNGLLEVGAQYYNPKE